MTPAKTLVKILLEHWSPEFHATGCRGKKGAFSKALCIKKVISVKQVSFMLLLDQWAAVYVLS